ncbi:MAG: RNA polymerase sigma-70 factor [Bacteroidales bacterium]|nr:RNA polymerase sigma-70 factor [Bacteroidales bacterium]
MKLNSDIERELIRGIMHGSVKAYEQMFMRHYPTFYSLALGLVKDKWVAEEIVQNVFMKVWLRRATLKEDESLYVYLFVLTKYEVLNYFRYKSTRIVDHLPEHSVYDMADVSMEDTMREAELHNALEEAVEALPPRRREIFRMSRFEQMSAKEIAVRTGLSVRTVEKHLELALRDLRARLNPFLFFLILFFNI